MNEVQAQELLELMKEAVKQLSEINSALKLGFHAENRTLQEIQKLVGTGAQALGRKQP